jgi:hemolysin activation/secretion protein
MISRFRDRNFRLSLLACLVSLALVLGANPTLAAPAQTPSAAEPGTILRGLEQQQPTVPNLESIITVPKEEKGQGLSKEKVFVLKGVVLDNSTVYAHRDLSSLYKDLLGQKVSFSDLNDIAQRLTRRYREDGYIFSRAILPPQKITDGVVHLRCIEGRIANVKIVGKFKDDNGLIHAMADRIRTSGAANTRDIERYLLLINDLPGITARSYVKPSATNEAGDLVIDIEEKSAEGSLSFDDRGSRWLGIFRGTGVAAFNDTFGLHDRTTFRVISATDPNTFKFADITHEEQIGSDGLKVKLRGAVTYTDPAGSLAPQAIEGDSQLFDAEGTYPVIRSRTHNFNLIGGFDALNSTSDVLGIQTAMDRVRTVRFGGHYDFTDALKGISQLDLMSEKGLSILGATPDGKGRTNVAADRDFVKGTLVAQRVQDLWGLLSLQLQGTGQVSDNPLLASEKFQLGGPTFGRAFDAGEITGDSGFAGVAELRYGGPVDTQWLKSYQLYTYLDSGRVFTRNPAVGQVGQDALTSAGLGTRFNLFYDLTGYVELDKPLHHIVASEHDKDPRVFFSILKRF